MATKQKLEQDIKDLQESIASGLIPVNLVPEMEEDIKKMQLDLANGNYDSDTAKPKAKVPKQATQVGGDTVTAILAVLKDYMDSNAGSGMDSNSIRSLIAEYLAKKKISISDLDQSVIDEIKKNQMVVLSIPNFGLSLSVDSTIAAIPNIYPIIDDILAGNNVYLIGEAGGGKAGSLNSKILTENGWKTYGTIAIGDKVWGEDGKLYEVDGVFDRGNKPVYGINMNDGGYTETCDEHLWKVYNRNDRSRKRAGRVLPLSDFKDKLFTTSGAANVFIDVAKAIPFKKQEHIVDPYLMGVLIGDGSITTKSISISKDKQELFDLLPLPDGIRLSKRNNKDPKKCLAYGLIKDDDAEENVITKELERVELYGKKSTEKHIPKEYLYDSIENRISLLQGLNDTDGWCDGSHFEFSTSSAVLANDYTELVRSLGGTVRVGSRIPTYVHNGVRMNGKLSFRVSCVFPEDVVPFRLSSKLSKYQKPTKYKVKRFISSVTYKGVEPVRCISVTNPSHLYITDDYIVTHNTYTAEVVAGLLKRERVTINCSQYTSPTEIVGGQTIGGYQDGKLIDAWGNGKILILDEMPRLDANTAGLFNDALAKSSKTTPAEKAKINSTNPKKPPIERNNNFGLIATGNIYPNKQPPPEYRANNQQDLSLLDRFSGSVYYTAYSENLDQEISRFKFLYDMLIGNYYDYTKAVQNKKSIPEPKGLRTVLKANNLTESAVVSYRTLIAFRIAFEYELVRALAKSQGTNVGNEEGKTLLMAFHSFLVAFDEDGKNTIINATKFTDDFIKMQVKDAIGLILTNSQGFTDSLTPYIKKKAAPLFDTYKDLLVADFFVPQTIKG